jgi:hypothetical protein
MADGDEIKHIDKGALATIAGELSRTGSGGSAVGSSDAAQVVSDVFQRASQLGGFLVLGFVAPVGPSASSKNGLTAMQRALLAIGEAALKEQVLKQDERQRQTQEEQPKSRAPTENKDRVTWP